MPAEFSRPANNIVPTVAARDQLAAETNAEYGLVGIAEPLDEPRQCGKVGIVVVGKGILIAAEDDMLTTAPPPLRSSPAMPNLST